MSAQQETINNLLVPSLLVDLIREGVWQQFSDDAISECAPFLKVPMVLLKSLAEIRAISLDESLQKESVLGIKSSHSSGRSVALPFLDANLCLFLAVNAIPGDDSAIALDYRPGLGTPQVVASDWSAAQGHCQWKVISETFDAFVSKLRPDF